MTLSSKQLLGILVVIAAGVGAMYLAQGAGPYVITVAIIGAAAVLLAGGGAGFIGLAFLLTSIHHWLLNPDRNMTLVLVPIGLVSILIGSALLIATTAIYILGRNRIRTTASGFSSVPGQS